MPNGSTAIGYRYIFIYLRYPLRSDSKIKIVKTRKLKKKVYNIGNYNVYKN